MLQYDRIHQIIEQDTKTEAALERHEPNTIEPKIDFMMQFDRLQPTLTFNDDVLLTMLSMCELFARPQNFDSCAKQKETEKQTKKER